MDKKVAIITGSTSGIGLEIAKKLSHDGYNIVLNGFADSVLINQLITEIKACKVECIYHPANMTKPEEIKAMIEQAADIFGSIDILINNAGIQHVAPIDEFPEDKLEEIIKIDLLAAFYTIKYSLPHMKKKSWGRIINISSAHGLVASPFKAPYIAAKHGLIGLAKSVALEVAEQGITVNCICPGYVKTPLVLSQVASTAKTRGISEESALRDVILGQMATKEFVETSEIAAIVSFLCTKDAKSITGSSITIDGGWTAH